MNTPQKFKPQLPEQKRYRIPPPSSKVQQRALEAGRAAWDPTESLDVPWKGPVLRLAACLLVAVGVVQVAEIVSTRPLENRVSPELPDPPVLAGELPTSPFVQVARRLRSRNAYLDVQARQQRLQHMLEAMDSGKTP